MYGNTFFPAQLQYCSSVPHTHPIRVRYNVIQYSSITLVLLWSMQRPRYIITRPCCIYHARTRPSAPRRADTTGTDDIDGSKLYAGALDYKGAIIAPQFLKLPSSHSCTCRLVIP